MNKRTYIAGPIGGRPIDEARAHFASVEKALQAHGHEVVNPTTLPHNHLGTYRDYMREDIAALLTCSTIMMLEGWRSSPGARAEWALAAACGMEILMEESYTFAQIGGADA